ncbi:LytTR family DNA-binding domain-containing protein [Paenibacillus piri]|uniref:LytTR family DNA-binding domain-containing protein n=1 Tax=Paenibacillus piri TaxID=2547395 RepID=UPI001404D49A|nr:LytTR family DNA-binding domain-containing protein [Paenibacillus piri]
MKLRVYNIPTISVSTNELVSINLNDIERFEKEGRYTIASIGDDRFKFHFFDLETIESLFLDEGLWLTDRSNVVNLHKVVQYDKKYGNLYFADSTRPASVAKINFKLVEQELTKIGLAKVI